MLTYHCSRLYQKISCANNVARPLAPLKVQCSTCSVQAVRGIFIVSVSCAAVTKEQKLIDHLIKKPLATCLWTQTPPVLKYFGTSIINTNT